MNYKCFLLLFLLTGCAALANAQVYSLKNYTTSDGLINNRTGAISQDAEGYIWIGTDYGICRFDGKKMKYISLPGIKYYYVATGCRRYKKYVLFTTRYGVVLCCGDAVIPVYIEPHQRVHSNESIALNDSVFLLASSSHLLKLEKNKPTAEIPLPFALSDTTYLLVVFRDVAGNIWVGSNNKTIIFRNGNFNEPLLLPQFNKMYCNIIKEDPAGNVYAGTDKGLFRFKRDMLSNLLQAPELLYTVSENIISGLAFDSTGHAWMSNRYGVRKFSNDFKTNILISPESGLASFYTWDAFCDRENNMWFATENGVNKLINTPVINYRFPLNEFPGVKSGLAWDDSSFYFTNGVSLSKIVHDKVIAVKGFHDEAGYLEERLWKTPGGKMLITLNTIDNLLVTGTHTAEAMTAGNALVTQNSKAKKWNSHGFISFENTYNDNEGNMWYGTNNFIGLYKNNRFRKYFVSSRKGDTLAVNGVTRDRNGDLWAATASNIIRCRVSTKDDSVSVSEIDIIDTLRGLQNEYYLKIFCDSRNRIWTGGSDGVVAKIEHDAGNKLVVTNYEPPDISSIRITDFLENDNGDVWVGTALGIDIFSTDAAGKISIRKDVYGSELCGKNIYFLKKLGGKIYAGTTGGMAVIDLSEEKIIAPPPAIFITETRIGNNSSDSFLHATHYSLPPDSNSISFYFNATSFLSGDIKYKYMLEGADEAWSIPATADNITYSTLRPGTYTFRVLAQNSDGVWSTVAAEKTFTIRRHFYNTLWFYLLCGAVFFFAVWRIYRYRLAQIKKLHLMRANISSDLHDDIGSTLSSITMMSNLVKQKIATDPAQSAAIASQIEESGRQMIYAMSDIVWSIKPGNDTIEQLINRLREYMNIMLEPSLDDYALIADEAIYRKNISMYLRRDIYLICKEIIHNTAKYADAKTLTMQIDAEGGMLRITSTDDGKGFDTATAKKGNGLQNIFMRVKTNRGSAKCNSAPGGGTAWTIQIPL